MERRFNQKRRGEVLKRKKSTVFMAAEGRNRTEKNYFRDFISKHKNLTLRMVPDSSTDPVGMAVSLAEYMEEAGFSPEDGDLAFCLIDHDCSQEKDGQILKALKIARKHGFDLIISNPCFELWFVCHFTDTPKNYSSSKEVLKDVEVYLPGYGKSDDDIYQRTESYLPYAIENAKGLEIRCLERGHAIYKHDFSPSTEVYKAIEKMLERQQSVNDGKPF